MTQVRVSNTVRPVYRPCAPLSSRGPADLHDVHLLVLPKRTQRRLGVFRLRVTKHTVIVTLILTERLRIGASPPHAVLIPLLLLLSVVLMPAGRVLLVVPVLMLISADTMEGRPSSSPRSGAGHKRMRMRVRGMRTGVACRPVLYIERLCTMSLHVLHVLHVLLLLLLPVFLVLLLVAMAQIVVFTR